MKILNISPTYFSQNSVIGGGEKYLTYLNKSLSEAFKLDNEEYVIKNAHLFGELIFQDLEMEKLWIKKSINSQIPFDPQHFNLLIKPFDVVIVHQCLTKFGQMAAAFSKLKGKIVIGIDHGGGHDILRNLNGEELDFFDCFIAQSDFASKFFHKYDVPIEIIKGPIDTDSYKFNSNLRKKGQIISVGRILPHKGYEDPIKCLSSNQRFIIVGQVYDQEYFAYLRRIIKEQNANVEFFHNLNDENVTKLVSESSLYVQSSKYEDYKNEKYPKSELLSLSTLEAGLIGTQLVLRSSTALKELIAALKLIHFENLSELRYLFEKEAYWNMENSELERIAIDISNLYGHVQFGKKLLSVLRKLI